MRNSAFHTFLAIPIRRFHAFYFLVLKLRQFYALVDQPLPLLFDLEQYILGHTIRKEFFVEHLFI